MPGAIKALITFDDTHRFVTAPHLRAQPCSKRFMTGGTSLADRMTRMRIRLDQPAQPTSFSARRIPMKIRNALLVSTLLAASSLAMAQGSGGGGGGGPAGNDPNAGTNAGATREGGDMQASGAMAHKSTKQHHMKQTKKPATDTTSTPGADASSATKGQ
jgi:hypothetical protein